MSLSVCDRIIFISPSRFYPWAFGRRSSSVIGCLGVVGAARLLSSGGCYAGRRRWSRHVAGEIQTQAYARTLQIPPHLTQAKCMYIIPYDRSWLCVYIPLWGCVRGWLLYVFVIQQTISNVFSFPSNLVVLSETESNCAARRLTKC